MQQNTYLSSVCKPIIICTYIFKIICTPITYSYTYSQTYVNHTCDTKHLLITRIHNIIMPNIHNHPEPGIHILDGKIKVPLP